MSYLKTVTGKSFDIEWAAPVDATENIMFLAKILNSDIDAVHNTFKDPEETAVLLKTVEDGGNEALVDTYTGYTRYCGFSLDNDGAILLTLKKQVINYSDDKAEAYDILMGTSE